MAFDDIATERQKNISDTHTSIVDWMRSTSNIIIENDTIYSTQKNDSIYYEDYMYRPETYLVPIMFGIIFIVGVVGNGTLIIVFIRHRAMRNVPNT